MKVTFRKIIYETYETDIPLKEVEELYDGDLSDAVLDYVDKAVKVDEEVEIDDEERGRLNEEDTAWEELQYLQDREAESITAYLYYQGLGL